jgi:hypothetical protein
LPGHGELHRREVDAACLGASFCGGTRHVPWAGGHIEQPCATMHASRIEEHGNGLPGDARQLLVIVCTHGLIFPTGMFKVSK